jgi:hypothetical protein
MHGNVPVVLVCPEITFAQMAAVNQSFNPRRGFDQPGFAILPERQARSQILVAPGFVSSPVRTAKCSRMPLVAGLVEPLQRKA